MTREGRVAGLTNSRRHRAEHGLCTLSVAFPKVDRTPPSADPKWKYFPQLLLSATQGSSKVLGASPGGTHERRLSAFPSCVPGAC